MGLQNSVPCWVVGRMTDKLPFGGEVVRLGDVCSVVHGKNQKAVANPEGPYPIYGSGGIMGWADEFICPANTVIIGRKGTINKPIYVHEPFWNVDTAFGLVADQAKLHSRYLFHFCKCFDFESLSTTSAIPSLTSKNIERIQLRLPDLEVQRACASRLDVCLQQESLCDAFAVKLDTLVKSRFVEMFGDPIDTNSTWPRKPIKDFCELRIGPFGSSLHRRDYIEGGHALINPSHIVNGAIVPDMSLTISDERYSEMDPYHLEIGDVVLGRRGEIGRCAVVCKPGLLCGTGSMIVRPKAGCRPDYLQRVISFPSFKDALEANAVGQTMKNLNAKIVGNAVVALPPIKVQDEFASFVEHIDKLRFEQLVALKKRGSQHLIAP